MAHWAKIEIQPVFDKPSTRMNILNVNGRIAQGIRIAIAWRRGIRRSKAAAQLYCGAEGCCCCCDDGDGSGLEGVEVVHDDEAILDDDDAMDTDT